MSELRALIDKLTAIHENRPSVGDGVFLDFGNILEIDSEIIEVSEDAITILGDDSFFKVLETLGEGEIVPFRRPENRGTMQNLDAAKQITRAMYQVGYYHEASERPDLATLSEYRDELNKIGYRVNIKFDPATQEDFAILQNTITNERYTMDEDDLIGESLYEAEYHGRKVPLGKPMKGDVKKSKVYVKNPKTGKVVKVNFGDKKMRIKKSNPKRRKSFRARHNCANPGPRTKARYWSCRAW